jgi:hypothetical protein
MSLSVSHFIRARPDETVRLIGIAEATVYRNIVRKPREAPREKRRDDYARGALARERGDRRLNEQREMPDVERAENPCQRWRVAADQW